MNAQQSEALRAIQALSIAAHEQTGIPSYFGLFTTELSGHPLILHAHVTIMPGDEKPWSMKGSTDPYRGDDERSLEGLRNELASWIALNRKEESAA